MTTLRRIVAALRRWASGAHAEHELHTEIESFAELRADELRAAGLPDAEARRRALAEIGGIESVKESVRERRTGAIVEQAFQDVRYAFRMLARSPGFTVVAVLVLALGIGANVAIFSLINAALFRPLPVRAPQELVFGYRSNNGSYLGVGLDDYNRLAQRTDVFAQLTGSAADFARLRVGDGVEKVRGAVVVANYFDVLGVAAALGRTFSRNDGSMAADPSVVIGHDLWGRQFNADPGIIGTTISLGPGVGAYTTEQGRRYTVVGIAPKSFHGTGSPWEATEYWVPLQQRAADYVCADPEFLSLTPVMLIGRLASGVTFGDAVAFMSTVNGSSAMGSTSASANNVSTVLRQSPITRLPFDRLTTQTSSPLAAALMAVSGLVLIIAAANLVGLYMARSITRRSDTAIRLTLGAGRGRIVRQWLTESLLLSLAGGLGGLAAARALVQLFLVNLPASFGTGAYASRVSLDVPLDFRVLAFTTAVCVLAGLVVGFAPAWQASKTDVLSSFSGSAASSPRRDRFQMRRWILIPQIALSLTLLLVSGVMVRALLKVEQASTGYAPEAVVSVEYQVPVPPQCEQNRVQPARPSHGASGQASGGLGRAARADECRTFADRALGHPQA
ncbi:MAG: ABC transporter permease [Acidobacteria bacterium]|nr:ABC transporter permease [Acidobacteriota bacterium]